MRIRCGRPYTSNLALGRCAECGQVEGQWWCSVSKSAQVTESRDAAISASSRSSVGRSIFSAKKVRVLLSHRRTAAVRRLTRLDATVLPKSANEIQHLLKNRVLLNAAIQDLVARNWFSPCNAHSSSGTCAAADHSRKHDCARSSRMPDGRGCDPSNREGRAGMPASGAPLRTTLRCIRAQKTVTFPQLSTCWPKNASLSCFLLS